MSFQVPVTSTKEPVGTIPHGPAETRPDPKEKPSTIVCEPHHPLIPAHAGIQFVQIDTSGLEELDARVRAWALR
jgi:hypothetical protein